MSHGTKNVKWVCGDMKVSKSSQNVSIWADHFLKILHQSSCQLTRFITWNTVMKKKEQGGYSVNSIVMFRLCFTGTRSMNVDFTCTWSIFFFFSIRNIPKHINYIRKS